MWRASPAILVLESFGQPHRELQHKTCPGVGSGPKAEVLSHPWAAWACLSWITKVLQPEALSSLPSSKFFLEGRSEEHTSKAATVHNSQLERDKWELALLGPDVTSTPATVAINSRASSWAPAGAG